jgi:hypothetical protein
MQLVRPAVERDVEVEGLIGIAERGECVWREVIVVRLDTEGEAADRV